MSKARRIDEYISRGDRPQGDAGVGGCDRADVERAAELAAEKVSARYLSKIIEELVALRREVEALRGEVEKLSKQAQPPAPGAGRGTAPGLREFLAREGFVLGSEARAKLGVSPSRLRSEAGSIGAVVLEMEGDIAVMDKRAYEEFIALLSSIKTSDPSEAARQMGRYERLFSELRRSGRVYFDARRSMWRLL